MRARALQGTHRRRFRRTTDTDPPAVPASYLAQRTFSATCPDQLWVADITYVRTWAGWLYVAVVVDACSRMVVGNALAESFMVTPKAELADPRSSPTRHDARTAMYDYIEAWHNPRRRHSALGPRPSALGYLSPA